MPLPFEQQPREGAKAFAAFKVYLELGPQRSLAAVAQELSKSEQLLKRWSAKFDWPARVQAHAAHLATIERQAIEGRAVAKAVDWEKTHESVRREAWAEAEKAIALVRAARERWEKSGRTPGFEGMARMLELAFKLKQFAAGMPGEIKQVNETHTTQLRVEWAVALKKVYGRPATVVEVTEVGPKKELAGVDAGADRTESHQDSTAPETSTSAEGE